MAQLIWESNSRNQIADLVFEQKLPPAGAIYKGKVVMSIYEYAISQAERTRLKR
jgi:hypothetical protein